MKEYDMVRFPTIRESSMRFAKVKYNGMVVDSRATSIFPVEHGEPVNYLRNSFFHELVGKGISLVKA